VIQEKYDEAVSMAKEYMQDPVHRYFKDELETKINDYGYQLINRQRFEQANKVLHMNVQLFPGSANVYDSYAESWWKLGNIAEAIKYYQIAIGKDPNGVTGDNARRMLAEIQGKKPM
jgi:tetratricopeptide (TPR) repeat protein